MQARDRYLAELRAIRKQGRPFPAYLLKALAEVELYGSEAAIEAAVQWTGALMLVRDDVSVNMTIRDMWKAPILPELQLGKAIAAWAKRDLIKEHVAEEREQALRFQALARQELGMEG